MSTLSLRLPDSLHRNLKQAADADGISINHFVSLAVAEKLSAIQTIDIISERAKGASRSAFLHAMSLVPRGEIIEGDEPRPKPRRTRHRTECPQNPTTSIPTTDQPPVIGGYERSAENNSTQIQ